MAGNTGNITNLEALGKDSIKGGIFFGSNLTPSGTFSNKPQLAVTNPLLSTHPSLMLTLQKVKDSLATSIQQSTGATTTSNATLESFLYDFVNLMIDYRDIRNYVFYGSANTELAYNINKLITDYPYSTLIGEDSTYSLITVNNYIKNGAQKTDIIFPEIFMTGPTSYTRVLIDNFNLFNFFDDSKNNTNWNNYELVDKNSKRYTIDRVLTPFKSDTIINVLDVQNVTVGMVAYDTIKITTVAPHGYVAGQSVSFVDLINTPSPISLKYKVKIYNPLTTLYDYYYYDLNGTQFIVDSVGLTSTEFTLRRFGGAPLEDIYVDFPSGSTYDATLDNQGFVRLYSTELNTRPFWLKITVSGYVTKDQFIDFKENLVPYRGFMISPLISTWNDFEANLTPIQNMLLSPAPINPTPWPRRNVTNNIMNITSDIDREDAFVIWLTDPTSLYVSRPDDPIDVDAAWSNWGLNYEYNLIRALALDETETNQLVRRCIPADIIGEVFDTDDNYFQRFILIAGWMFDNIKLYSKFIQYSHTVNYTNYNQVSPQYYKYLASHWGLSLFNDDSVDFSKLVIQTVSGSYFGVPSVNLNSNNYYKQTLQTLQYTREKYLLYSLIYLYKSKGTQGTIQKLISLLGAPDGFLALNEYAFQVDNTDNVGYAKSGYKGKRIIDNEKVHVPNTSFEIDPDYLLDKTNIHAAVNKPYVYRAIVDNELTHNLREISILTDPNGAIDTQINNVFGNQSYNYITFGPGEFSNLQKLNNFFLMPLTLPDRFFGMSFDYMIPVNGIRKGVGTDQEEATCNVFSLYKIAPVTLNPSVSINVDGIVLDTARTTATITTTMPHGLIPGDSIYIGNSSGVTPTQTGIKDNVFNIELVPTGTTIVITGTFGGSLTTSGYSGWYATKTALASLNNAGTDPIMYSYPLAIQYPERNRTIDASLAPAGHGLWTNPSSDFDVLYKRYPSSTYVDDTYIITRLEGNDLVVRLRIKGEIVIGPTTSDYRFNERVALLENVFQPDGLNHSLRMIIREDGMEVYKDYEFIGLARWMNIVDAGPYHPYEVPKSEIEMLLHTSDPCNNSFEPIDVTDFIYRAPAGSSYATGLDILHWWDMFVGMPDGVDMYFKKFNFFSEANVSDYEIGDNLNSTTGDTSEFYIFEVANPTINSRLVENIANFNVPAMFDHMLPNYMPRYYGYALAQSQDDYGRTIIPNLALTNKRCYNEVKNGLILNKKQDFFKFADTFGNNAWMPNIHKSYSYDLFSGEMLKLYELYSAQVLTYLQLEPFMELIEQKFKSTFENFVPIVMNLFEFGRLIRNSEFEQAKMRLPGSDKVCTMQRAAYPSVMTSWVFNGIDSTTGVGLGTTYGWYIKTLTGTLIESGSSVTTGLTRYAGLIDLRNSINSSAYASHIKADVYSNMIRVTIDYDWFLSTFGVSANDVNMEFREFGGGTPIYYRFHDGAPAGAGLHPAVYDSCGTLVKYAYSDYDVCGSIKYSLPKHTPRTPYIYFETEHRSPFYVHFSTEFADPTTIHFDPIIEP